jgi:hypothetical protein
LRHAAEAVDIRAASLYKHLLDEAAMGVVLIEHRFAVAALAFEVAFARDWWRAGTRALQPATM